MPLSRLFSRYGYRGTTNELGKLCARYDIPVPPRGHWARKAARKRIVQQPLPRPDEKMTITFDRPKQVPSAPPEPAQPLAPEIAFERDPVNFVVVEPNARLRIPAIVITSSTPS